MTDERVLLERARAGEPRAFELLVRAHFARVYATAYRLAGNHEDAEDLAQETFVRAHRGLADYRGEAAFATWLARIVVHLAQDRFRASSRRPRTAPIPVDEVDARSAGATGEEVDRRELRRLLADAVERLPERLRTPFVLRVLEGADYVDVAGASGISIDMARTRVMQARRALARFLAPFLRERGGEA